MTEDDASPTEPAGGGAWLAGLGDALALGEKVSETQARTRIRWLGKLYLSAARELLAGVIAELEVERATNAIRLARHLYEYELEFAYLSDLPGIRIDQWFAEHAQRGLILHERIPELGLRDDVVEQMRDRVEASKAAAAVRKVDADAAGKGEKPEGWRLPDREAMERALLDREPHRAGDYDLFYRHSSSLSHPGSLALTTYVEPDKWRAGQAASLAAHAFLSLLDTVNWMLGAPHGADIRELVERFEALVPARRRVAGKWMRGSTDGQHDPPK